MLIQDINIFLNISISKFEFEFIFQIIYPINKSCFLLKLTDSFLHVHKVTLLELVA
jgi:hypothetical protein